MKEITFFKLVTVLSIIAIVYIVIIGSIYQIEIKQREEAIAQLEKVVYQLERIANYNDPRVIKPKMKGE